MKFHIFHNFFFQVQTLSVGDIVKISDNIHSVKELQKGHGEWNDSMKAVSNDTMIVMCLTSTHKYVFMEK